MAGYVIRRLLWGVIVLLGVSVVTFLVAFAVPSDPARLIGGAHATAAALAQIRRAYGMDQPLPVQYLTYMGHLLRGDLGQSYLLNESVRQAIFDRLPATAGLCVWAILFELMIGLPLGVVTAVWHRGWPDQSGVLLSLIGFSFPPFVLGNLLLTVFAAHWPIFPYGGASGLISVILPALTLGLGGAAWYARLLRATMLDALSEPYILTARARGLSQRRVVLRHALRTAVSPLVTQIGLDLAFFLGGVIVVETVFAWPGVGYLAFQAIGADDVNLIVGIVLLSAVFVVVANILVDVAQAWLDPRIRLG